MKQTIKLIDMDNEEYNVRIQDKKWFLCRIYPT